MECPFCQFHETDIVTADETVGALRRRRQCQSCLMHFMTYEKVHSAGTVYVSKRDGSMEPFSAKKLERSIALALSKLSVSTYDFEDIIQRIISAAQREQAPALSTGLIAKKALEVLRYTDQVAWIRYAAMTRQYEDLASFNAVLKASESGGSSPQTKMAFGVKSKYESEEVI